MKENEIGTIMIETTHTMHRKHETGLLETVFLRTSARLKNKTDPTNGCSKWLAAAPEPKHYEAPWDRDGAIHSGSGSGTCCFSVHSRARNIIAESRSAGT